MTESSSSFCLPFRLSMRSVGTDAESAIYLPPQFRFEKNDSKPPPGISLMQDARRRQASKKSIDNPLENEFFIDGCLALSEVQGLDSESHVHPISPVSSFDIPSGDPVIIRLGVPGSPKSGTLEHAWLLYIQGLACHFNGKLTEEVFRVVKQRFSKKIKRTLVFQRKEKEGPWFDISDFDKRGPYYVAKEQMKNWRTRTKNPHHYELVNSDQTRPKQVAAALQQLVANKKRKAVADLTQASTKRSCR